MSSVLFGINEVELRRGEGEWVNMQPVLRKTIGTLVDLISRQQNQIDDLCSTVSNLKRELQKKVERTDVDRIVEDKKLRLPELMTRSDLVAVHALLVDVKAEVERKASIRYVDEALHRKIDKSELSMRPLLQNAEHMSRLSVELSQLQQKMDRHERISEQISEIKTRMAVKDDVSGLNQQLRQLSKELAEKPDLTHLNSALSQKVNLGEIDGRVDIILRSKHDGTQFEISALERMLLDHEHRLSKFEFSDHGGLPGSHPPTSSFQRASGSLSAERRHDGASAASGLNSADVYESRKSAQLEMMAKTLVEVQREVERQAQGAGDLKIRVQRLEGNHTKVIDSNNQKLSDMEVRLGDLHGEVKAARQDFAHALDEHENRFSSLNHKVESTLFLPLGKKIKNVEIKIEALEAAHAAWARDTAAMADKVAATERKAETIEQAVVTFNDGLLSDMRKELHRAKSERANGAVETEKQCILIMEKQQTLEKHLSDVDARISSALDMKGTRFSSVQDLAAAVRTLKQTGKTLIDTTLQQNSKLQAMEKQHQRSLEVIRASLLSDVDKRLSSCESGLAKISALEVTSALTAQSISHVQQAVAEMRGAVSDFNHKVSTIEALSRNLRVAQMTAQNSAVVAKAATAVVEGLAADINGPSTRNSDVDEDFPLPASRMQAVINQKETSNTRTDPSPRVIPTSSPARHGSPRSRRDPKSAESVSKPKSRSTLEKLREEKNRLVKELYGDRRDK